MNCNKEDLWLLKLAELDLKDLQNMEKTSAEKIDDQSQLLDKMAMVTKVETFIQASSNSLDVNQVSEFLKSSCRKRRKHMLKAIPDEVLSNLVKSELYLIRRFVEGKNRGVNFEKRVLSTLKIFTSTLDNQFPLERSYVLKEDKGT